MNTTKIVVTFSGYNSDAINEEIEAAESHLSDFDIVEIRGDVFDALNRQDHASIVRRIIDKFKAFDKEIIYTYRTSGEGGKGSKTTVEYQALLLEVCKSMDIDYIDIEMSVGKKIVQEIIETAKTHQIKTLLSYHNFKETLDYHALMDLLSQMNQVEGDVFKFALYPTNGEDVDTVVDVQKTAKAQYGHKVIGISMGELGKRTRVLTGDYAPLFTYGYISRDAAPGQIHISELRKTLTSL